MQVMPNQLVELHLESAAGPQVYRTRVEDVYDDFLVVGAPMQRGQLVPIRVGTALRIEFKVQNALKEGRFRNQAILEKRFQTNIPLLQFRLLGTWEKTQERSFVRVPVFIDAVFVVQSTEGGEVQAHTGLLLNLSGGGFQLRTSYPFELDDEVNISFYLEKRQIVAKAFVARFVPTDNGHDLGFSFVDLLEQTRQAIIKFVFKRQIDLAEMSRENPD